MINNNLKTQLQNILQNANLQNVPEGILAWWPDVDIPTGNAHCSPVDQSQFEAAYSLLSLASLKSGWVRPLSDIKSKLRDVPQDGAVPLSLAIFDYAKLSDEMSSKLRCALKNNEPLEGPQPTVKTALKSAKAFFSACLLPDQWAEATPKVRSQVFEIELSRALYLTNPDAGLPDEIRVDTGQGTRTVQFGDRILCLAKGQSALTVQISARFGTDWLYSSCTIMISDQPAARRADEIWPLSVPGGASGRAYVYRSQKRSKKRRYFIMCEGFPGGYSPGYVQDNLNQFGLFDSILAAGVDILTIGLDNGLQTIEYNAELVITCLQQASKTGEKHVVGGVSMGGLLSRYALMLMETRGQDHDTAAYLSIDTPHQGSRTSVAVQWFAQYFQDFVPRMDTMTALLNSPANQQFLPRWLTDGKVIESDLRTRLYADFKRMGDYPKRPKLFAVASGRGDGEASLDNGIPLVSWNNSPIAVTRLITTVDPDESAVAVAQGNYFLAASPSELKYSDSVCWEGVAGSLNTYNAIVWATAGSLCMGDVQLPQVTACAVPTVSALDVDLSPSISIPVASAKITAFDDYIFAHQNLPHTGITPAIRDWILEKITAIHREHTGKDDGR